jgi:hypothetical protein
MPDEEPEPWVQVSRFAGRKRGAVLGGAAPSPALPAAAAAFWRDAPAFQGAVAVHAHALATNAALVGALWRHLCAWRASAHAAGATAPPLLQCVGLGSVGAQGPSGCSLVQLALLLLLARLLQRSAGAQPPSAAELLEDDAGAGEGTGSCSSGGSGSGSAGSVEAFDPCFSPLDVALLASVGVAARSTPWLGPPSAGPAPALLFMPHCPGVLYTAALAGYAWRGAESAGGPRAAALALPCLCIIGNGFQEYVVRRRGEVDSRSSGSSGEPAWGAGLRQRILDGLAGGSGSGSAAGEGGGGGNSGLCQASLEERMPPLALDALVAVFAQCQGGGGEWALRCTPLEPLVAPAQALAQALSTTALHSVEWHS